MRISASGSASTTFRQLLAGMQHSPGSTDGGVEERGQAARQDPSRGSVNSRPLAPALKMQAGEYRDCGLFSVMPRGELATPQ
jgi:hypothetical protein